MKREIMSELIDWKNNKNKKPLILEGARQVGKTYILKEFGKQNYENLIYVNCENPPEELSKLFLGSIDPKRICTALEILYNETITENTLIFFDEIQEIPRALTSLKYFNEDKNDYNIVASGSLIGLFLHQGTSFPVGQVERLKLKPLNFKEFLIATDNNKLLEYLQDNIERTPTFSEILYDKFNEYIAIGGMPEAVKTWIETNDIESVEKIHNYILSNYLNDFSKHTDATTTIRIRQVWDGLVPQFAKNNNKFLYGTIRQGARAREYEMAIQWLIDSGVVQKVSRVSRGDKIPLMAYQDFSAFKLYFLDVGLFRTLANIPTSLIMNKNNIFSEFNGLLVEQFVLQELSDNYLFYWTSRATSEVDFVTQLCGSIVPIEVKSGENLKAKSLKIYREKYNPVFSIRISLKNLEYNNGLLNIPLYMTPLFNEIIAKYYPKKS
ncbi:MAG: AAA family ATPase [Bifidobacteriaceae bacterium]|jgi:predicted AAA+ superfamily ATPase|nr:AAA family ATPase [Bifidobacteriaceae bacterium]